MNTVRVLQCVFVCLFCLFVLVCTGVIILAKYIKQEWWVKLLC